MWIQLGEAELKTIKAALAKQGKAGQAIISRIRSAQEDQEGEDIGKYREAAKEMATDGELEVDDGAIVSRGDDPGAYVMAWLWVDNEKAGIE